MSDENSAGMSSRSWRATVPPHWEIKALKFCADLINERVNGADCSGRYVGLEHIESKTGQFVQDIEGLQESAESVVSIFCADDVLFGKLRPYLAKCVVADTDGVCSSELLVYRPVELMPKYLNYVMLLDYFISEVSGSVYGAKMPRANSSFIGRIDVPQPPRGEQQVIVAYLDTELERINRLIAAKKELLEHLQDFQRATFISELVALSQVAVGKPDVRVPWLPYVPTEWKRCKIKHVVVHFDQGISPQCESRQPEDGEWGVLKVGCINTGVFNPSESKALPPQINPIPQITVERGDLVISRANTRDLIGRCAVVHQDFPNLMLSDKHYRIKFDLDRCYPEFIRLWLWAPWARARIEERANGASPSMLNIDRKTIREMDLVLPRVEDQISLIERVSLRTEGVRHLQRHAEREIALLQELRTSTITDAVFGQISTEHSIMAGRKTKRVAA